MNKEILIITGVLVGSFLVANHLMKSKRYMKAIMLK
jgi:flagellar motor component MotA